MVVRLSEMGAENSVLEGCVWGEEVSSTDLDWTLQQADLKDGGLVTVFEPKKYERKYDDMLQCLAQVRENSVYLLNSLVY